MREWLTTIDATVSLGMTLTFLVAISLVLATYLSSNRTERRLRLEAKLRHRRELDEKRVSLERELLSSKSYTNRLESDNAELRRKLEKKESAT